VRIGYAKDNARYTSPFGRRNRMNSVTYSLCQKPVLGVMMFVASLCSFPPLFTEAPLPLQQADATVTREIHVPVTKPYFLSIAFEFPSAAAIRDDDVVGSRSDLNCLHDDEKISPAQRVGLGRLIPVHVLVRGKQGGAVVLDKTFNSLCLTATSASGYIKTRTAARIDLEEGDYTVEVRNVERQAGLDEVKTSVSLVAGHGK